MRAAIMLLLLAIGCGSSKDESAASAGSASSKPSGNQRFEVRRDGDFCVAREVGVADAPPLPVECPGNYGDQPRLIERAGKRCVVADGNRIVPCPLPRDSIVPAMRWKVAALSDGQCRIEPQPRSALVTAIPGYNVPCPAEYAQVTAIERIDGKCRTVTECPPGGSAMPCPNLQPVDVPCPPK